MMLDIKKEIYEEIYFDDCVLLDKRMIHSAFKRKVYIPCFLIII